jgi:hypothetical protein
MSNLRDRSGNVKPKRFYVFTFSVWWWSRYFGLPDAMTGILDTREEIDKSPPRENGPVTPARWLLCCWRLSKSHSRSRSVSYSAGFTKSAVPSWSGVSRYHPPPAFHSLDSEAVSYAHGGLCDLSHCTPPIPLAYVYFEDEPGQRSAAKLLSKDEAQTHSSSSELC